jgi:hypothetical protein
VGVGVERDVQEHVGGVLTCGRGAAPGCGARWRGLSARTAARRPLGTLPPSKAAAAARLVAAAEGRGRRRRRRKKWLYRRQGGGSSVARKRSSDASSVTRRRRLWRRGEEAKFAERSHGLHSSWLATDESKAMLTSSESGRRWHDTTL